MFPYTAADMIRVMNTDLAAMMERDRWHRTRPELYTAPSRWLPALLRWRRPWSASRFAPPNYELLDARL